jgi:hypothetical protein
MNRQLTWSTLIVTNVIKLSGLGIALHEVFWRSYPRTLELVLAAFMMAGAQISEELILRLAARFFGGGDSEPPKKAGKR